ncbi:TPA: hypothetical protein NIJ32_002213 [Pseudomonas aeruginosa]|nr:hypothetical protein [Pseudomonas aeruginosa]
MSEVKRYIIGRNGLPEFHDSGEYVATSDYDALAAEAQALREEVAALRARVVVPDGFALVPIEPNDEMLSAGCVADNAMHSNLSNRDNKHRCYQSMLNAAPRLNGKAVSEGLVQGMAKFAREIICGALDGGSFDGADIQESAERHGLIAKQVMNEPCRGPEEYCACAWSTSFPAECYRVTPKLRALLNEDKENSNG